MRLLRGPAVKPVKLTLQDAEGRTFVRDVPRQGDDEVKPLPNFEFNLLPGKIGYVVLRTFGNDSVLADFYRVFPEIAQTNALIIDVRSNGGGSSGIGWNILGCLTDKPFKTLDWKMREYHPPNRARGKAQGWRSEVGGEWKPNGEKLYSRPVLILASAGTGSAAEDFCVAFDFMRRGKIIGEPTNGSTGQPLFFDLPGGGRARVCTKRDTYPDGKAFVGVGVQPNIIVRQTIADLRAGRDSVLQAALDELKASPDK